MFSRSVARLDLFNQGVEVRQIEDRVFSVSRPPLNGDLLLDAIRDASFVGVSAACPIKELGLAADGDPYALALVVAANHDYPDADMLGHYLAD
jgi:hypothetical protein